MLWEYWQYLTTPCEKYVKAMGYLEEMVSIKSRADRLKGEWKSHLRQTKEAMIQAAQKCQQKRTALVCGSGWLLDVPLQELANSFEKVVLMDIVHPNAVRKLASKQIELVEGDLSGVARSIYKNVDHLPKPSIDGGRGSRRADFSQAAHREVRPPKEEFENICEDVDFVCSVNLLSQLPILPVEYLRKRGSFDEAALNGFKQTIQEFHLSWIRRFPRWVLVTDVESIRSGRVGEVIEKIELAKIPDDMPVASTWEWNLAPFGEDHPEERTVRRVVVCGS